MKEMECKPESDLLSGDLHESWLRGRFKISGMKALFVQEPEAISGKAANEDLIGHVKYGI